MLERVIWSRITLGYLKKSIFGTVTCLFFVSFLVNEIVSSPALLVIILILENIIIIIKD